MLFVAVFKSRGKPEEATTRRLEWKYPQGIRPVAEYWLQSSDPAVISVIEADSATSIMAAVVPWVDVFDVTVTPAVTAEEGLQALRQMRGQ